MYVCMYVCMYVELKIITTDVLGSPGSHREKALDGKGCARTEKERKGNYRTEKVKNGTQTIHTYIHTYMHTYVRINMPVHTSYMYIHT